jgi:hypothetical protein
VQTPQAVLPLVIRSARSHVQAPAAPPPAPLTPHPPTPPSPSPPAAVTVHRCCDVCICVCDVCPSTHC